MTRRMVKLITADDFFSPEEVLSLYHITNNLKFSPTDYGTEVENFNLVAPDMSDIFSKVVGETIIIDEEHSGIFRRPIINIHFESFETPEEWCFAVALEQCTFNIYKHLSGAKSALEEYRFNYRNLFEWDYHTNILLEPGQGLFYRPWLFHSFNGGLIQTFKMKTDK